MKRIVVVLGVAAVMAAMVALTAGTALAQSETETFNDRVPIEGRLFNACTQEFVTYEGTQYFVLHITEDPNGGFHVKGHFHNQIQGVSTSGAKYVTHQTENNHQYFDVFSESGSNFTFTQTTQVIRQGSETSADDFQAKGLMHLTVNANGEITSQFEQFESECK
jgi:hypothetical protein